MEELKKAYEAKDLAVIDPALEKINEAWKNASEEMYKAQADGAVMGKQLQIQLPVQILLPEETMFKMSTSKK